MLLNDLQLAVKSSQEPVFVELGALDGVELSNTYLYERCFGWRGILIEANSHNYRKLLKSGRYRSQFVHSAVCSGEPRNVSMTRQGGRTAGQVAVMSAAFLKKWHRKDIDHTEMVPCMSLSSILRQHGHESATFLSLDVEGAEAEVLSAVDPAMFELIMVEWGLNDQLNARVHALLTRARMRLHRQWTVDHISDGGRSRVYVGTRFPNASHRYNRTYTRDRRGFQQKLCSD